MLQDLVDIRLEVRIRTPFPETFRLIVPFNANPFEKGSSFWSKGDKEKLVLKIMNLTQIFERAPFSTFNGNPRRSTGVNIELVEFQKECQRG